MFVSINYRSQPAKPRRRSGRAGTERRKQKLTEAVARAVTSWGAMSEAKSAGGAGGREGASREENGGAAGGREERADEAAPERTEGRADDRGGPSRRDEGAAEHYSSRPVQDFTIVKLRWRKSEALRQNYHGITVPWKRKEAHSTQQM